MKEDGKIIPIEIKNTLDENAVKNYGVMMSKLGLKKGCC
jgi:hypothetical protein